MEGFTLLQGRAVCLLFLPLIFATPALHGDDQQPATTAPSQLKSLSLEQLSQLEVTTPTKEPAKAFRTPAAIFVITGEDIRRSGVTTIPEALRLAPGVEVARIDSNKWAIGIRGFGSRLSRSVLVLIDGRTVYTPLFAGTYWEVQDTMLEDVDRIEVIRGPGGTIWGPNAIDGVINIITKPPTETHGILASAGGGNMDQGFGNFRYGAGNDKGLDYRFYGKAYTRGPEYHQDGDNFDDWRGAQAGFRIEWRPNARDTVDLQGDAYHIVAGERVSATTYAPPYERIVDGNADLSGGNVMAVWQRTMDNGGDLLLQIYYDRTNRWEPNLADYRDTYDVDFVRHIPLGKRHRITWGLSARANHADDPPVVSGLQFVPYQRTDQLYTAYLQDEFALIDKRLSLVAGTKLLRTNFTGFEFEPSIRLLWTPSDRETVWAAFTHAVRTPSDAEENFYLLGYTGSTVNGLPFLARFNPNPNFAPEQMNGWELGYRRLLGSKFSGRYRQLLQPLSRPLRRGIHRAGVPGGQPSASPLPDSRAVRQRPARLYQGRRDRPRIPSLRALAAARFLFLSAHEHRPGAWFRRYRHRRRHRRLQPAERRLDSVLARHLQELPTGFDLALCEHPAGRGRARLFHRRRPPGLAAEPPPGFIAGRPQPVPALSF